MAITRKQKLVLAGVVLAVLAIPLGYQGVRMWWYRGYSKGTRTGVVRKLSTKGPPYCKYVSGELVLQGTQPGQPAETWEFSLDDTNEDAPLYKTLHDLEKVGLRVTLAYRQDLGSIWRCSPSEYFVTGIEK